jgi:hypothetical protein
LAGGAERDELNRACRPQRSRQSKPANQLPGRYATGVILKRLVIIVKRRTEIFLKGPVDTVAFPAVIDYTELVENARSRAFRQAALWTEA